MAKEWRSIRIEHDTYLLLREVANKRGVTYSKLLNDILNFEIVWDIHLQKEGEGEQHTDSINDSISDGITAAGHGYGE
jgi:hypothetical protein